MSGLASPDRLRRLFTPSSLALVGASDTSGWARNIYQSLRTAGFEGRFVPVHPRHPTAFGITTLPSLRHLEQPIDLAFALVPTEAVESVVEDAAAAGIGNVVVLAAGFGERGEEGKRREQRLVEMAERHRITLLGPNGLGFINAIARIAPYGLTIVPPLIPGRVGVVLQSGALASAVQAFARNHAIGLSLLVSMGNEAMVTTADVIEYLIEDEGTGVIALFLEEIRQPRRFAVLARRALEAGKPIVAIKVGRSPEGRRMALAHTGAMAGDDAVADAVLRQLGVLRVRCLEELLVTAGLLGSSPPLRGRRMGVITASGGACDIIADRAHEEGIEIPGFAPGTVAALERVLPPFIDAQNPVDITGFALAHQGPGVAQPVAGALRAVSQDPNVDFVLHVGLTIPSVPPPDPDALERRLDEQVAIMSGSPVPVVPCSTTCSDVNEYMRGLQLPRGIHQLAGLEFGLSAIGHALTWHERRGRRRPAPGDGEGEGEVADRPSRLERTPGGPWDESEGRRLLAMTGVPMVPAELAQSIGAAVAAADRLGYPVAVKVCSAKIAHKSDIGGVALGLTSPSEVREAVSRVRDAATAALGGHERGEPVPVLVSPMRTGGHELLAGVTVDGTFGPVLAVGLGGVWAEALGDVALRMLPIETADALEMLGELRGAALLRGDRGQQPVDLDRVADALVRLARAALLLGPSLVAVEVNPLYCSGDVVEGLDVLVVTAQPKEA